MLDLHLLGVLAATIAAFVSGAAYYAVLGEQLARVSPAAARASSRRPGSSPSSSCAA